MQLALYGVLPVLLMALALAAAILYGDGSGISAANAAWAGETFPPMCGF